ncbi:MAG TPA: serine/threonine-protein kinase PknK, partial [Polyangia bacterium]
LEPRARRLLELCAVAGAPLPSGAAARALEVDAAGLDRAASLLRAARLARASGARGGDTLEPYHDRVRGAVLTRLLPDARRACHRRLAPALEASGATDPAELALHWREAGDDDKAGRWAALAADRAKSALAFDRAARYYRLSLKLRPVEGAESRELRTRLGDALASAGRGVAAANAYLAAAKDGEPALALELERRAAEQLLRSGHVDDGLRALRAVLATVGLHLPATPRRALASLLYRRARLRLRGLSFRPRDASEVAAEELTRIDVCWSVAAGLAMVDTIRGSDFQTLHLQLALDAGEPRRIARALAMEAALTAADGGPAIRRAERLVSACDALVARLSDPLVEGEAMLSAGICAFLRGSWRRTHELSTRAEALLRERCTGAGWERASAEIFTLWSAAYLGQLGELVTRVPVLLRQAEERGDLYAAAGRSSGLANLAWLASGDLAQARARVEEAERRWSRASFQFQHYWNLLAHAQIDLYLGDGGRALERLDAEWRALSKSLYLRIQNVRIEALHLRARARLAAACDEKRADRDRLLAAASSDARRIARERMPWSDPLARLVEAGVAQARGDRERALALLQTARLGFDGADMQLFAATARRRRGELLGSGEGASEIAAADEWLSAQQIRAPAKMVAMLAPGFPDP